MKKSFLIIIFCVASLLPSCELFREPDIENQGMDLISEIRHDGEVHLKYSYNSQNLVIEEKTRFTYTGHSYNTGNQLVKSEFYIDPGVYSSSSTVVEASMNRTDWVNPSNTEKSLTQELEYDKNDRLVKKHYIRAVAGGPEYMTFTYENDRIMRSQSYWQGNPSAYTDFFYDDSGNLIKEERYNYWGGTEPELSTTTEYEFDDMNNPYYAFRRLRSPGKYTNPNNIVKQTYTIHFEVDDSVEKVTVTTFTYDYNDKGYPVMVNGDIEYIYR